MATTSVNYTGLDQQILQAVREGKSGFTPIMCAVSREASQIAAATGRESFRVVDARLQALRKRGLIKFNGKLGWSMVEVKA